MSSVLGIDTKITLLTENQFERPPRGTGLMMTLLIVGGMGGFAVVFAGFIVGQLWTR